MILDRKKKKWESISRPKIIFMKFLIFLQKINKIPEKKIKFWNDVKFFEVPFITQDDFGGRKSYWF